jgi:hypothetical protein
MTASSHFQRYYSSTTPVWESQTFLICVLWEPQAGHIPPSSIKACVVCWVPSSAFCWLSVSLPLLLPILAMCWRWVHLKRECQSNWLLRGPNRQQDDTHCCFMSLHSSCMSIARLEIRWWTIRQSILCNILHEESTTRIMKIACWWPCVVPARSMKVTAVYVEAVVASCRLSRISDFWCQEVSEGCEIHSYCL